MASPYTPVTITAYNSSPPSDDASQVASNQVQWSKHISKIGDPLKTAIQSIDTNVTAAFAARLLNSVLSKSSTYTLANADAGKLVQFTGSSNNTLNLQAAATATADFACGYRNDSTGTLTIDPNSTEQVDGATTVVIRPGESGLLLCTGTAWFTVARARVTLDGSETLTNKTITAPVFSGTATGTYTLGGTPTISAPSIDTVNLTGGQVTFPASQNSSAGANVLDDYEEGTWTPSIGGNATYLAQIGTYTKIGRLVFISCNLSINVIGTGSTTIITGLPFTPNANGVEMPVKGSGYATSVVSVVAVVDSGTGVQLWSRTAASVSDSSANAILASSASVQFSGCYYTT